MPLLVHLAAAGDAPSIRRSGIRMPKQGAGVYAMPVLANFLVSHQWLRELKRSGVRTLVAVHFRIPDDEPVLLGHFNHPHTALNAAQAVDAVMRARDPLGMQIIIERAIKAREIHAVRRVSQVAGWRYYPHANGQKPFCGCPSCQRGMIRSRKLREAYSKSFGD